jgi:E3 ubiquitin-protein ligase HUWE1
MNVSSRKQQDEVPTHMAKIMLEKNFVAILTTALSEIDLNYPNVWNLVAAMLRLAPSGAFVSFSSTFFFSIVSCT